VNEAGDLFDEYAEAYEQALSNAIAVSGEDREYFAGAVLHGLPVCLREAKESPRTLLDFGCGDGATTPLLLAGLKAEIGSWHRRFRQVSRDRSETICNGSN